MPPEWYQNAAEGDEHDVNGTKWYVKEVNVDVIWYARTKYGKAEACSVRQKAAATAPSYSGPYGWYGSSVGKAYQKAVKASQDPAAGSVAMHAGGGNTVWTLLEDYAHASEKLSGIKRNPIKADRVYFSYTEEDLKKQAYAEDIGRRIGEYWNKRFLADIARAFGEHVMPQAKCDQAKAEFEDSVRGVFSDNDSCPQQSSLSAPPGCTFDSEDH